MFKHRLQRKSKLSRKEAYNLIITMTMFGEHPANVKQGFPVSSEEEIKQWFQDNDYNFDKVVEECRDPDETIPLVENMIGSVFTMIGDDETETIITSNYQAAYEIAAQHLERALTEVSFSELESAIVRGIASIEAFINYRAERWNAQNPSAMLLDSKENKVSFDDKIDKWIPIMSGGRKLDKSDRYWSDFKRLRGIRDNLTIHSKTLGHTVKYSEMADLINVFRTGIAGMLIPLHLLCRSWIPSQIIRGYYTPEVQLINIG